MGTGANRLSFREPRRRRRIPLFLSFLILSGLGLGLGFASYLEPTQTASAPIQSADDTLGTPIERTRIEIATAPAPLATAATAPAGIPEPRKDSLTGTERSDASPKPAQAPGIDIARLHALDTPGLWPPATSSDALPAPRPAEPGTDAHAPPDDGLAWEEHVVASGDSLSGIFSQMGIYSQLRPVLAIGGDAAELQRLHPGERLRAGTRDGRLETLIYEPRGGDHFVEITREGVGDDFVATRHTHEVESQRRIVHAQIEQSLFLDGSRAGLSDAALMQIADVFGWDIDFAWDIRQGDRLIVVYERLYRDGEYLRDGPVLAAEFQNRGRTLRALRYAPEGKDPDYYTPDGESMRQAFIRTPVDVGRISSQFGPRRHPILGYTRQHQGVDYAAPTGTPIRAAGNGRIVHRGNRGGYGKTVIIDHGNNRRTLYAHMNGFRSGQSVGSRVQQGQIIGYVGMTGMATGPHLHYEFHVHGKPVNPVTVDLPRADPLPKQHLEAFRKETAPLLAQIDTLRETQVAEIPLGAGSH
ncbi:peptidase M23 [Thioalkalivibrio paradoxus ARh 1]|uniref:Peptidase M23 n=2 Tax=Thioalkalivibrio paradoxus TaxID=108010 RepID=W0DG60_9GAMM|nr:peptidase M23 [Thioalkalivibrio paradoxus ARh 1]